MGGHPASGRFGLAAPASFNGHDPAHPDNLVSRSLRVEVRPSGSSVPGRANSGRVAAFFSGGVDSFFTLLKHLDEISVIVFVLGLIFESMTQQLSREFGKC